jgi:hypothetical protein
MHAIQPGDSESLEQMVDRIWPSESPARHD